MTPGFGGMQCCHEWRTAGDCGGAGCRGYHPVVGMNNPGSDAATTSPRGACHGRVESTDPVHKCPRFARNFPDRLNPHNGYARDDFVCRCTRWLLGEDPDVVSLAFVPRQGVNVAPESAVDDWRVLP